MMIDISIISDIICPWCYIGKRNLDLALAERSEYAVQLQWLPYQLAPEVPAGGIDRRTYMLAKFGDEQRIAALNDSVREHGEAVGLTFRFERIEKIPNTVDAHRLIRWAGGQALAHDMSQRLFEAYFEEGLDIGEHAVLADLAGDVGLDQTLVAKLLKSDVDNEVIHAQIRRAQEIGVRGVPTLIFQQQWVASGAQAVGDLVSVLDQIEAEAAAGRSQNLSVEE